MADRTIVDKVLEKYFDKFRSENNFAASFKTEIKNFLLKHIFISKYAIRLTTLLNVLLLAYPKYGLATNTEEENDFFGCLHNIIMKLMVEQRNTFFKKKEQYPFIKDFKNAISKKYKVFELLNSLNESPDSFKKMYKLFENTILRFLCSNKLLRNVTDTPLYLLQDDGKTSIKIYDGSEKMIRNNFDRPNLLMNIPKISAICENIFQFLK